METARGIILQAPCIFSFVSSIIFRASVASQEQTFYTYTQSVSIHQDCNLPVMGYVSALTVPLLIDIEADPKCLTTCDGLTLSQPQFYRAFLAVFMLFHNTSHLHISTNHAQRYGIPIYHILQNPTTTQLKMKKYSMKLKEWHLKI